MKSILIFLSCLICLKGHAETIGNVEYHLPKEAQNWVTGNKLESDQGTTIIYIPKSVERLSSGEFFGVNVNKLPTNIDDINSLKETLKKMYPQMDIGFFVLDKKDQSLLYEWFAVENNNEKIHGWGRIFSTKDGTVLLGYQTQNIGDINIARSIWLPVLKEAQNK